MSKQSGLHALAVILATFLALGCGDFQDDVLPTPTRAPTSTPDPNATPTPTPSCGGEGGVPGCRNFTWVDLMLGGISNPSSFVASTEKQGDPGSIGLTLAPGNPYTNSNLFLDAGAKDANGVAEVRLLGPTDGGENGTVTIFAKLLLDALCLRIYPETVSGELYCDGRTGQGVDVKLTAPGGTYRRDLPRDEQLTLDLGDSAPPGSMVLHFMFQQARASQGDNSDPQKCLEFPECPAACPGFPNCPPDEFYKNCYQPMQEGVFTTGTAFVQKGAVNLTLPGVSPPSGVTGAPFDCDTWQVGEGPGRIVYPSTDYDDATAGDTAAALRLGGQ